MGLPVSFYHLERHGPEVALPRLLTKVLAAGHKAVVRCRDEAAVALLDEALWTFDPASFLPHGTADLPHADLQPVLLTTGTDVPNGADVLVLIDGADSGDVSAFARCLYMFDSRAEETLAQARSDWKHLKDAGHDVTYWQQTPQGGWTQKA